MHEEGACLFAIKDTCCIQRACLRQSSWEVGLASYRDRSTEPLSLRRRVQGPQRRPTRLGSDQHRSTTGEDPNAPERRAPRDTPVRDVRFLWKRHFDRLCLVVVSTHDLCLAYAPHLSRAAAAEGSGCEARPPNIYCRPLEATSSTSATPVLACIRFCRSFAGRCMRIVGERIG